jgi:hypothetical protein
MATLPPSLPLVRLPTYRLGYKNYLFIGRPLNRVLPADSLALPRLDFYFPSESVVFVFYYVGSLEEGKPG